MKISESTSDSILPELLNPSAQSAMKALLRLCVAVTFTGIVLACLSPADAQSIGDTSAMVRKQRGLPAAMRDAGERQIWTYADGTKVFFFHGRVVADDGSTAEEDDPSATPTTEVSTPTASGVTIFSEPSSKSSATSQGSSNRGTRFSTLQRNPRLREWLGHWPIVVAVGLGVISFSCQILIIVRAFKEGMFWGLGCLFIPIVTVLFVIQHWYETRGPFLLNLACVAVALMLGILHPLP